MINDISVEFHKRVKRSNLQTVLLLGGFVLASISLASGLLTIGPIIEAEFFPPVRDVSFSNPMRIGRTFCWDLNLRKVRNILPYQSFYWINYGLKRDPISVTLDGHALPTPLPVENDSNRMVTIGIFCADLPMDNGQVIVDASSRESVMQTIIVYRPHFLWDLLVSHPPLPIPKEPMAAPLQNPSFRLQSRDAQPYTQPYRPYTTD
jgi:hypothetical protein